MLPILLFRFLARRSFAFRGSPFRESYDTPLVDYCSTWRPFDHVISARTRFSGLARVALCCHKKGPDCERAKIVCFLASETLKCSPTNIRLTFLAGLAGLAGRVKGTLYFKRISMAFLLLHCLLKVVLCVFFLRRYLHGNRCNAGIRL